MDYTVITNVVDFSALLMALGTGFGAFAGLFVAILGVNRILDLIYNWKHREFK